MKTESLRLCWINYACYEIILPNGKKIVIDPCIDYSKKVEFTADDFGKVDYIILSHSHYDHTMEIANILKNGKAKLIAGEMSMYSLCRFFDVDFDLLFPVSANESYEYDDFCLDVYRGKHTLMNNDHNTMATRNWPDIFPEGHRECDIYGSMEYMNYLITTNENIRILNWGGPKENFYFNNIFDIAKKMRPNIIIKQLSTKYTPEEFAETIARLKAQIVLPLHQDGVDRKGQITSEEYIHRANEHLEKLNSKTRIINPKRYEWLSIYTGAEYV